MPWRECRKVDERLRFVARLLEGEKMAVLCREFDISRKTGYKIFTRYQRCGLEGLKDRSRRSYRQANRLPFQIESLILGYKQEHPSWGAPKIREKLRRLDLGISLPAISTVHAVLDRHGLVTRGRKARYRAQGTVLTEPAHPNDLWCADYKGEFMLADKRYCYPLTVTDSASRYLLCCEALETTKETYAFTVFERVFKDFGLPLAIRTDNDLSLESTRLQRTSATSTVLDGANGWIAASRAAANPRSSAIVRSPLTILDTRSGRSDRPCTLLKQREFPAEGPSIIYEVPKASTARLRGVDPLGKPSSKRGWNGRLVLTRA